jgi:hypothetical protein
MSVDHCSRPDCDHPIDKSRGVLEYINCPKCNRIWHIGCDLFYSCNVESCYDGFCTYCWENNLLCNICNQTCGRYCKKHDKTRCQNELKYFHVNNKYYDEINKRCYIPAKNEKMTCLISISDCKFCDEKGILRDEHFIIINSLISDNVICKKRNIDVNAFIKTFKTKN